MTSVTTKLESLQPQTETAVPLFDNWFDPTEEGLRERLRPFIEALTPANGRCVVAAAIITGSAACCDEK